MKGLGTVLSKCQNRASSEYRRTRAVLAGQAERRSIPRLFSKDAEISYSTDALNALDDTLRESYRTIDKKYGGSAKSLHEDIRKLTREVLDRLKITVVEAAAVDMAEDVNNQVTRDYQTV
jgi:hypothetical protein